MTRTELIAFLREAREIFERDGEYIIYVDGRCVRASAVASYDAQNDADEFASDYSIELTEPTQHEADDYDAAQAGL